MADVWPDLAISPRNHCKSAPRVDPTPVNHFNVLSHRSALRPLAGMTRGWDARKSPAEAGSPPVRLPRSLPGQTQRSCRPSLRRGDIGRTRSCDREAALGATLPPCCPAPSARPGSSEARSPAAGGSLPDRNFLSNLRHQNLPIIVSLERVLVPAIRASLWDAGAIRNELQPIPSLRVMKNAAERMTLTGPHAADAMAQIHAIGLVIPGPAPFWEISRQAAKASRRSLRQGWLRPLE